jgi:CelD/BcsL family acetyltransferase involved in cellulose biosynthesis
MEEVVAVSRKSWKFKAHTSILDDEESVRFFTVLAERMASKGWLTIWMLKLDGKPIAYQYALTYKGRVYGLKIDFDDDYRQMAPSKFLQRHIIQQCFSRQMKEFDLLGEKEAYKMDFTTSYREHIKYMVFGNTPCGKALYALERHKMAIGRLFPQRKERSVEPGVS